MDQLYRHELNFDIAWQYVYETLNEVNTLSSELLSSVDFKRGVFFTLLPIGANIGRLYEFKTGLILPQYPEEKYHAHSGATFTRIPTIKEELAELILNEIKSKNACCIFDDVVRLPTDKSHPPMFDTHGLFYENETYYLIKGMQISKRIILECLRASSAIWHSLCILTKPSFSDQNVKELSLEFFQEICMKSYLVIIGAYDGEGYVFWEEKEERNNP